MASKIVLPAVVLLVALAIGSGDALQCYECMSVGEASDSCKPEILMKDESAKITCSINTMSEWYNKLRGHTSLNGISSVFMVDNVQATHPVNPQTPMACVKMNLRVNNQPVTLRTCQDSNISTGVDPCETITTKINDNHKGHAKVVYCSLCNGDKCNGSYLLSPTTILSIVPLLGSILLSHAYNSA